MHAARERRVLWKTLLKAQAYIGPPQGINIANRDRVGRHNAKRRNHIRVVSLKAGESKCIKNMCRRIENSTPPLLATIPQPGPSMTPCQVGDLLCLLRCLVVLGCLIVFLGSQVVSSDLGNGSLDQWRASLHRR